MKKYIRKISFQPSRKIFSLKMDRLFNLITNSSRQLSLTLERLNFYSDLPPSFLEKCNFCLQHLKCTHEQFISLCGLPTIPLLTIASLRITNIDGLISEQELSSFYAYLEDQVQGINSLEIDVLSSSVTLPYLPSLKRLHISHSNSFFPILPSYLSQLQDLTLSSCSITDVSMLGEIPSLSLYNCYQLADISTLNNNVNIEIFGCKKIQDFTLCFANSVRIKLGLSASAMVDLSRWKRVREIKIELIEQYSTLKFNLINGNEIPTTVKDCYLQGQALLDTVRIHRNHKLSSLYLGFHDRTFQLQKFCPGQVSSVFLQGIKLNSLKCFENGRTHKVSFKDTSLPKDLSCLSHLRDLCFINCNVPEIRYLVYFHLLNNLVLNFSDLKPLLLDPNQLPKQLKHLHLTNVKLVEFYGLHSIPSLYLDWKTIQYLYSFVEEGGILDNQRLEFSHLDIDKYDRYLRQKFLLKEKGKECFILIRTREA